MKKITSVLAAILALPAIAFSQNSRTYEVPVGEFTQLKVQSPINVNYVCNPDSAGLATFTTSPEMSSVIGFTNDKGKLTVEFTTKGVRYALTPTVTVYSRFLTSAENNADSLLKLVSTAPVPELKLKLMGAGRISAQNVNPTELSAAINTGSGSISVSGKCKTASLSNRGSGSRIIADQLEATIVKCKLLGSGEIGCWPVDELKISQALGLGSGSIIYRGHPKTIKGSTNNVKIKHIDE